MGRPKKKFMTSKVEIPAFLYDFGLITSPTELPISCQHSENNTVSLKLSLRQQVNKGYFFCMVFS